MVANADGKTSPVVALFGGGIAGGFEAFCTYPFEFAKTRVQLYGHGGVKNPFRVVANVIQQEGLPALYKGCSTMIVVRVIVDLKSSDGGVSESGGEEPKRVQASADVHIGVHWQRCRPFSGL